jgi:hypothetical protein
MPLSHFMFIYGLGAYCAILFVFFVLLLWGFYNALKAQGVICKIFDHTIQVGRCTRCNKDIVPPKTCHSAMLDILIGNQPDIKWNKG